MRFAYNILFTVFFVLSSPYYFFRLWRRGQWQAGFWQRFGVFDAKFKQSITNRHVLWMHAVSVGEVNICTQLIRALEPRLPNVKIVVSTTTTTGMAELQKKLPVHIGKFYYPVDRRKYVARAIAILRPEAVVLVEAEIWPNFIWRLRERKTPLFLVNARLSAKSHRGYRRFGFLFRELFASFRGVGAQNEGDAKKLRDIGCRPEAVQVFGNLKFDTANLHISKPVDVPGMLAQLGVPADAQILVAGSTHDGEELLLVELFRRLKKNFPKLFLIIAPRHFERTATIGKQLAKTGVKLFYRTDIHAATRLEPGAVECLLVNTTGELMNFYQAATVVFVGKSLTARGGQNPIEPAALGKPTVFGPNMQNFEDIVRIFLAQNAVVQVKDASDLEKTLADLLGNETRRRELGELGRKVVKENQGAIDRTVDMIIRHLDDGGLYIAPEK
ncbi:MAG: 3-deoxy-D-manno-octulosonic acid transferase [Verrucomicrobiota bacterium]